MSSYKVLVVIVGRICDKNFIENVRILNNHLRELREQKIISFFDYACVSSFDDFSNYEEEIEIKYKLVEDGLQLTKFLKIVSSVQSRDDAFDYDWYIKFRPELRLFENINFDVFLPNCVNARTREYKGPHKIKFGSTVGGEGFWSRCDPSPSHSETVEKIILDDQFFVIGDKQKRIKGFNKNICGQQHEWIHTDVWNEIGFGLNPVGIDIAFMRNGQMARSGDL